jgi:hypothetical protein
LLETLNFKHSEEMRLMFHANRSGFMFSNQAL